VLPLPTLKVFYNIKLISSSFLCDLKKTTTLARVRVVVDLVGTLSTHYRIILSNIIPNVNPHLNYLFILLIMVLIFKKALISKIFICRIEDSLEKRVHTTPIKK
jgi:hypothetical protein